MELIPAQTAFLFPGQGSQALGMGQALARAYPLAMEVYKDADRQLGFALSRLAWSGPEADLDDTLNTQPALLVHSVAALRVLGDMLPGLKPAFVAGHSMGEISALVACGSLSFPAALQLARRRGELMKEAGELNPGGMAAILGLDIPSLGQVCAEASTPTEIVQVANDNCPGQCVISGSAPALDRALVLAQAAGARRVVRLAVSIAAHSPLMQHALEPYTQAVAAAAPVTPSTPIIGNVNALPLESPSAIREDLIAQLTARVRWTETIEFLKAQGVNTFLEIGSGEVLSGLVKRIDRSLTRLQLGTPDHLTSLTA